MQNTSDNYMPAIFFQKISSSESANLQLMSYLTSESVDAVINKEMEKVMAKYAAEEQGFVDQKLLENPVVCERRAPTRPSSESSSSNHLQQQRAESCRKSRINNKVKKAKSKFRHQFITKKLSQNAAMLECIRDVIANAEARVRNNGCSEAVLQKLRRTMGVDRMDLGNLADITKQLGNAAESWQASM